MAKVKELPKDETLYAAWDIDGGEWVTKPEDKDNGRYIFPKNELRQVIEEYIAQQKKYGETVEAIHVFEFIGNATEKRTLVMPKNFKP